MVSKLMVLTDLCKETRNWFESGRKYFGQFSVENGTLNFTGLKNGQYYRIIGSLFNDGVHKFGQQDDVLEDEEFNGAIWPMGIPPSFIVLAEKIRQWREKYEDINSVNMSPLSSESFGGYSYTKGGGSKGSESSTTNVTWQSAFKSDLNVWRKM